MYIRKKCPLEYSSTVESVDFSTAAMVVSNLEPVHHNFLSEIAWTPEAYQAIEWFFQSHLLLRPKLGGNQAIEPMTFQLCSLSDRRYQAVKLTIMRKEPITKGQLISKAKCQAVDSPKKRTNEFAFFDLKSCYLVKSNVVRSFFWRI